MSRPAGAPPSVSRARRTPTRPTSGPKRPGSAFPSAAPGRSRRLALGIAASAGSAPTSRTLLRQSAGRVRRGSALRTKARSQRTTASPSAATRAAPRMRRATTGTKRTATGAPQSARSRLARCAWARYPRTLHGRRYALAPVGPCCCGAGRSGVEDHPHRTAFRDAMQSPGHVKARPHGRSAPCRRARWSCAATARLSAATTAPGCVPVVRRRSSERLGRAGAGGSHRQAFQSQDVFLPFSGLFF